MFPENKMAALKDLMKVMEHQTAVEKRSADWQAVASN